MSAAHESLGKCGVCGEGETFPVATSMALPEGGVVPLLMRRCDHCESEFSGHIEAAANLAIVRAVRDPEGLTLKGNVRERMAAVVRRAFPLATDKENAPFVEELVAAALAAVNQGRVA